jgi:hypothetical protein
MAAPDSIDETISLGVFAPRDGVSDQAWAIHIANHGVDGWILSGS